MRSRKEEIKTGMTSRPIESYFRKTSQTKTLLVVSEITYFLKNIYSVCAGLRV